MKNNGGGFFLENGPQSHTDAVHEEEVYGIVEKILDDTTYRRRILTIQELCHMKYMRPHYEQYFPTVGAYFFTIDGELGGERVRNAMLAGNCVLVFAESREAAEEIALSGLNDTVKFADEYSYSNDANIAEQDARAANAGIIIESGGRKSERH